jgi:uncharacterized protein (DUF362 family)
MLLEVEMQNISRREFLKVLLTGIGAVAAGSLVAACSEAETPSDAALSESPPSGANTQPPQPTRSEVTSEPAQSETPAGEPLPSPTAVPAGAPDLAVARGPDPEELVRKAFAAFGGMETFVKQGMDVIIKPNICVAYHSYEYAATTNPWVVGALVRLALEAGAKRVRVMDYPFGGTQEQAYAVSGIEDQVRANGGEMAAMPGFKFVDTDLPNAKDLKSIDIFDDVLSTDVLIDVPVAKHHGLAGLSLGMKNLMGIIGNRSAIHRDIGQRLADLATKVYPTVTVIDAVRILTDNGPTGGDLNDVQKLDTLIVSPDVVAADSYAATLFGRQPQEMSYIVAGTEMGLGRSDLATLKIEEIAVGG